MEGNKRNMTSISLFLIGRWILFDYAFVRISFFWMKYIFCFWLATPNSYEGQGPDSTENYKIDKIQKTKCILQKYK